MTKLQPALVASLSILLGLAAFMPVAEARGGGFGGGGGGRYGGFGPNADSFNAGRFQGGVDRGVGWRGNQWGGQRPNPWMNNTGILLDGSWAGAPGGDASVYMDQCRDLYAKALSTGSSYWWDMWDACQYGR